MELVNNFALFELEKLDEHWVNSVWTNEFFETPELPSDYGEVLGRIDVNEILVNATTCIKQLIFTGEKADLSVSVRSKDGKDLHFDWKTLLEFDIDRRGLLAVLFYLLSRNPLNLSSDRNELRCSLKAASLYFMLIVIPGSSAFLIFHPNIYNRALKTLKIGKELSVEKTKTKKRTLLIEGIEDVFESEDETPWQNYSDQEKVELIEELNSVLQDLVLLLKTSRIETDESIELTIENLIRLTRLEVSTSNISWGSLRHAPTISSLAYNAYIALKEMCSPIHGNVKEIVKFIMKYLLPSVLLVDEYDTDLSMQHLTVIRDHSVRFIQFLVDTVKNDSYPSVSILLQHMCIKVVDRAEWRQKVSQSVVDILKFFPLEEYTKLVVWLFKFAHFNKASNRLFALEVISKLLYENHEPFLELVTSERNSAEESPQNCPSTSAANDNVQETDEHVGFDPNESCQNLLICQRNDRVSQKVLLGVVIARMRDISSSVRAKALTTLADCILNTENSVIQGLVLHIFGPDPPDGGERGAETEQGFLNYKDFVQKLDEGTLDDVNPLPSGKAIVDELLERIGEQKFFVRKAALQVLENVMKLNKQWVRPELLEKICKHARDPAIMIRKQLVQCLTDLLLLYPDIEYLHKPYLSSVLPGIKDSEVKVQEKVMEAMTSIILNNVTLYVNSTSVNHKLPWIMLKLVMQLQMRKLFARVCDQWQKANKLKADLINKLKSHVGTENNVSAFVFLHCLAPKFSVGDPEFVFEYYKANFRDNKEETRYTVMLALDILAFCYEKFPAHRHQSVMSELLSDCKSLQLCIMHIAPALDVVVLMCRKKAETESKGREAVRAWATELLEICERHLEQNSPSEIIEGRSIGVDKETYLRFIFTLGEVSQFCPGSAKPSTLETLLTFFTMRENAAGHPAIWRDDKVLAAVIVSVGKLCLQDSTYAQNFVVHLGNILRTSKSNIVKINTMCALADICIRYTSMVEPLIPQMCVCMKDENVIVRENTVVLFIHLLQQDYLKVKGASPLFYNLLSMLTDSCETIRALVNHYLLHTLIAKQKNVMFQHLEEVIFYFNQYKEHEVFSKIQPHREEGSELSFLFDLSGQRNREFRYTVYRFMVDTLDDEHKIKVIHKLCTDILGGVLKKKIQLEDHVNGTEVLKDSLYVLSSDEIRLNSLRSQADDDMPADEIEMATAILYTAKKDIISKCVKQCVIETIVPILIQLKNELQALKSPLLHDLMRYIRDLMKDYKNEVNDILAADKTLAAEITYDLKKLEEQEGNPEERIPRVQFDPLLVEMVDQQLRESITRRSLNMQNQGLGLESESETEPESELDQQPLSDSGQSGNNNASAATSPERVEPSDSRTAQQVLEGELQLLSQSYQSSERSNTTNRNTPKRLSQPRVSHHSLSQIRSPRLDTRLVPNQSPSHSSARSSKEEEKKVKPKVLRI